MKKKHFFILATIIILVLLGLFIWRKMKGIPGGALGFRGQLSGKLGLPQDYYAYFDLPDITDKERNAYCKMSDDEWEKYYQEKELEAKELSDKLEQYIRDWYYGKADARIPKGLLPPSIDNEKTKDWTLQRPEEIDPEKQWYFLAPAHEIDPEFKKLYHHAVDNHVTYLNLIFIAPFDAQLIVEGDFPRSREMSYHILEPFDPRVPVTGTMGVMEVPIIDIDIEPDQGNINPFRIGANRNAAQRHYHLTFDLKAGNAAELNPVLQSAYFRAPGNTRVGGPFASSGPYGDGAIIPSFVWLRYYAPDKGTGPLAGVSRPKALLRLKTGEAFWLQPDSSLAVERQTMLAEGTETPPIEPMKFNGPGQGWSKMFGIWEVIAEVTGYVRSWPDGIWPPVLVKKNIRDKLECYFSQGPNMPSPGNIPHSATDCPYNNYLVRSFFLGKNKVYAITGKLPTTPKTRNGETTMEKAEARYWSICHTGTGKDRKYQNALYGCLMDDEVGIDSENNYLIVWSRGKERPSNAREECGVTWQEFGTESTPAVTLRWMSVYPDHYMEEFNPNDNNIPWETGAWMQKEYDKSLVGENKPGVMGPYHPVIHYLEKEEFEALGCPVDPKKIPEWK